MDASFNNLTKLERDFHGLPVLCLANLTNNRITSISPELVAKTRCNSNTGVVNKLVILLEGMCITKLCRVMNSDNVMISFTENPILCQDDFQRLVPIMHAQEARLQGTVHCLHPMEDVPEVPTIILTQPPLPILRIQSPNPIEQQPNSAIHPTSNLAQLIMPPNIVVTTTVSPVISTTTTDTLPTTESLLAQTTLQAEITQVPMIVVVDMIATSTIPSDPATGQSTVVAALVTDPKDYIHPISLTTPQPERSSTIQQLSSSETAVVEEQPAFIAEPDNSVNESFPQIQVMGLAPDRNQQSVEPEEPPEQIHDDTAPI